MDERLHVFGIRHHGPGSAASVVRALDAVDPAEVLVEGPAEGTELLSWAAAGLVPPVALLVYAVEEPAVALFSPFAEYSPEWQAIRWALARKRPVSFVDLPAAVRLQEQLQALKAARETAESPEVPDESGPVEASEAEPARRHDPLGDLAQMDGYEDGEAWWNALVEERGHEPALFAHLEAAMAALREGEDGRSAEETAHEARREACMRQHVREALARTTGPIAAVVGAWHGPALRGGTATADKALLRGMPRLKVAATWVPWSDTRLAAATGYSAGIAAPGWYRALWEAWESTGGQVAPRDLATRWQTKVAHALRAHDLPAPTSSVIDAVRLVEALAALRDVARPGLPELRDATMATLCRGEDVPWRIVEHEILVGSRVGEVGADVPQMPLAADLALWQKRLRLKPEATEREVAIDLRSEGGGQRSILLHRLLRLDVPWGRLVDAGRSRGTFRERWIVCWQPELSVRLAEALRWGTTVEQAATARTIHELDEATALDALADLVREALLADLERAALHGVNRLQAAATAGSDLDALCAAVPPLVDVLRYGTAREMPRTGLAELVRGLSDKVHVGLVHGSRGLDAAAAEVLRALLVAYDRAIHLLDDGAHVPAWHDALDALVADDEGAPLLRGFATRVLHDASAWDEGEAAAHLAANLSPGVPLAASAAWLEGFLGDAAHVLLHDTRLLDLVDAWLCGLSEEALAEALPLFRRATSGFGPHERQRLIDLVRGERRGPVEGESAGRTPAWDAGVALLQTILGLDG